MNKYKLTAETKEQFGITFHRIEATAAFGNIRVGEKGGFVENDDNLEQSGNCWIYLDAFVSGDARVCDDSFVSSRAWVSGHARIYGHAHVCDDARISGNAKVGGDVRVYSNTELTGDAWICGGGDKIRADRLRRERIRHEAERLVQGEGDGYLSLEEREFEINKLCAELAKSEL